MQFRLPSQRLCAASLGILVAACGTPSAPPGGERYGFKGGEVSAVQRGNDCELTLQGILDPAAVTSLTLANNDLAKRACRNKWVVLDIADGSVGSAITVGSMLRNRGFNTRLKPGSTCHTVCLLVFAAGTAREIPSGSPPVRLGFSQIRPDEDFGTANCQTELDNRQMLNLARYLRAMLPGVTSDYMLQEIRATDCRRVRELPASDALTAGIATKG